MSLYERLLSIAFQGKDPRSYLKIAGKVLVAGFLGVIVGWIMQPFFTIVLGIPYYWAYWPAVGVGFVINIRSQVKMNTLKVKENEQSA